MDLLALLRNKAQSIPLGDHTAGLNSVLLHIEVSYKHLARGQSQAEYTAFTDAIYRTNLAFEGGVKEAYRVLTKQDPTQKRPFEIEKYLESNKFLRPRILSQFTTYRTEWRNPSSHDYTLDFDEGEALLAIVSVSVFVYVLLDEIAEKLAEDAGRTAAESQQIKVNEDDDQEDLLTFLADALRAFSVMNRAEDFSSEAQFLGAIHGFLAVVLARAEILSDFVINNSGVRVDLLVRQQGKAVFIEVKRSTSSTTLQSGINQLYAFSEALNAEGILFIQGNSPNVEIQPIASPYQRLIVISNPVEVPWPNPRIG
jgi:hypothetical protein